jgi:molecular chaperone GrpE (heat shock protein)
MPITRNAAVIVHHVSDAPSPWLLAGVAAAVALIGVALGRLSAPRRQASRPARTAERFSAGAPAAFAPAINDRMDQLALACLHLADSVTSPVLRDDIDRALHAAGYESLDPVGQPFDPSVHEAVERRRTTDARTHNVVAATYRAGWSGRGQLLRSPEVAVYRLEASK